MKGESMKNFIILLLTVFILSCATAPEISDDGFISSQPDFQVRFKKPIIKKSVNSQRIQDGNIKSYMFSVNNTEGILIQILSFFPGRTGATFSGLEDALKNWGRMVLDPVDIDGRQWIKFVAVFNNKALFTGYSRFMDQSYISVGRICNASAYEEEIGSFRSGASLKYGQGKLWDKAFAHTDQLFSIGKVAPAESQSEKPLSAKEVQTTPEKTKTEAERPPLSKEKPKIAAIPKDVSDAGVSLRKEPMKITNEMKIAKMLVKYDFFDFSRNPIGSFANDLVDNNDGTVTDKATGLMWQKSGSLESLENRGANKYVKQLNSKHFAGYSDWRMPTIEELASILARSRNKGVHIAPVFDSKQTRCWTVDQQDRGGRYLRAWITDFENGEVSQAVWHRFNRTPYLGQYRKNTENYVKAVRSLKEIQTTPEKTKTGAERPPLSKETPKVASIPKDVSDAGVSLRKEPMKITNEMKIIRMLVEYGFFDFSRNPIGSFANDLVDSNDGTVTDKATGLMWQKSGSSTYLNTSNAKVYIKRLNQERFAGHSDWRMPTVEELASLLAKRRTNGVHIAQVFDYKQTRCWTIDTSDSPASHLMGGWIIDFQNGEVSQASWRSKSVLASSYSKNHENYVKAVRSVK
jgi:hypothetical protein